jgi:hypothetical protein
MADPTQPSEGASVALERVRRDVAAYRPAAAMDDEDIARSWRLAKSLALSGMYKGANNAELTGEQAFAKILIGRDLGISATQSLMVLDLVKGNIQVRGKQLLAWVRASQAYDYEIIERTPEQGTIRFFAISKRTGEWAALQPDITFTLAEARAAGLVKDGSAWKNWPANMCLWRCASIGVNLHCPDLLGGIPIYTEADSFEDRAIGAGQGSGEPVGWKGLSVTQAALAEQLLARAETLGHAGLSKREVMEQRLNGQAPPDIDRLIAAMTAALDTMEAEAKAQPEAEIPDAEVVPHPLTLTLNGEVFEFNDTDDPYAMITAAIEEGPASMEAVSLDLLRISETTQDEEISARYEALGYALHEQAAEFAAMKAAGDPDQATLPDM